MEEILKENERLRMEVECLTETLDSIWFGLGRSVDFWRERYLELLRCSLVPGEGSRQDC